MWRGNPGEHHGHFLTFLHLLELGNTELDNLCRLSGLLETRFDGLNVLDDGLYLGRLTGKRRRRLQENSTLGLQMRDNLFVRWSAPSRRLCPFPLLRWS